MSTPPFAETDRLCAMLEAWGAVDVAGDYLHGELRWTMPQAVRCYVTPRRSGGFAASAAPLGDGPFVCDERYRATREEAIVDACALAAALRSSG